MKKFLALMLSALLLTATFTGCASSEYDTRDDDDDDDDDKDKDKDDDDSDKDDDDDKDKDDDDSDKDDDDDKDKDDDDSDKDDDDDDDEPLSTSDYKEQVTDLTIDYLSAYKNVDEILLELDSDGDLLDQLKDLKDDVDDEVNNAEKYLKKVQKLNPPKKMKDFHEDLISALEKSQNMLEIISDMCNAEDEDEFETLLEKGSNASVKTDEAFEKLAEYDDIEWFTDEIEDEFGNMF